MQMKRHSSEIPPTISDISDNDGRKIGRQGPVRNALFGERLKNLLDRRFGRGGLTEISRITGAAKGTVSSWLVGSMPAGDTLFKLADALEVDARWLATGIGEARGQVGTSDSDEWVKLPRIDLTRFEDGRMPEPTDTVLIRREHLASAVRTTAQLWVADMMSDTMPDIAHEGDQIICRAPDSPLVDGRVYVFIMDGRPLVRRVSVRPEGLLLKAGDKSIDPILIAPDRLEQLVPVGRVLAALTVQAV